MAVFTQVTADKQTADYLYELNENLTYMFNNLTPEDNYSEDARLVYVQRGERIGSLEVRSDKIEAKVTDDEKHYNSSFTMLSNLLSLNVSTPSGSSSVQLTGDKIALKTGKFTIDSKNLTIDGNGNATFSGTVSAATINGGTINGTTINGGDEIPFKARKGYVSIGDFVVSDEYGRHILQSSDECTGMSTGDLSSGELYFWAGWGQSDVGDALFLVNTEQVHINGDLFYKGQSIRSYIKEIVDDSK